MHLQRNTLLRSALLALGLLGSLSPVAARAQAVIPLDPRATYLHTNNDGNAQASVPIDLAALGLQPGDPILLERLGYFDVNGGGTTFFGSMVAVFSSTDELGPHTDSRRVPGALEAGPDFVTFPTLNGGLPTDIPEDFGIAFPGLPGFITVTIPQGARYLFVGPNDTFFGDNTVPEFYGIRITLLDTDRDGVLDNVDQCVPSDLRPQVDTGSGPTSVANVVDGLGCTIQDYVNAYQIDAKNHGQYVSSITHLAKRLADAGLITGSQKGELVSGAAQSDIGRIH